MMKEGTEVVGEDFEVFFHFYLCANGIVELDQPGENEKSAYEEARKLIEEFLHNKCPQATVNRPQSYDCLMGIDFFKA